MSRDLSIDVERLATVLMSRDFVVLMSRDLSF